MFRKLRKLFDEMNDDSLNGEKNCRFDWRINFADDVGQRFHVTWKMDNLKQKVIPVSIVIFNVNSQFIMKYHKRIIPKVNPNYIL